MPTVFIKQVKASDGTLSVTVAARAKLSSAKDQDRAEQDSTWRLQVAHIMSRTSHRECSWELEREPEGELGRGRVVSIAHPRHRELFPGLDHTDHGL